MMLTKKWTKNFNKKDILNTIDKFGPVNSIYSLSEYSLTWFIELIFRNSKGKPMRLLPYQSVALNMLWHKKFPMLLMSRGGGKCQAGNTLVQTSCGMFRFDELINPSSPEMTEIPIDMDAIGENGSNKIAYGWNNGFRNTKKIITDFGFECENTLEHKIRALRNGKIEWIESKDIIVGDRVLIVRDNYSFGKNTLLSKDQAWWLGATIGDGMITQKNQILLTNIDQDIVSEWLRIGEDWSQHKSKKIKNKPEYVIYNKKFAKYINEELKLNYKKSKEKEIPLAVRTSPANIVASFLSGLFDTDGGLTEKGFSYSTSSKELSIQVQSCLLAFGILSKRRKRLIKYKEDRKVSYEISVTGSNNLCILNEVIGFRCTRKQARLKELCARSSNPNKDVLPHEIILDKLLTLSKLFRSLSSPMSKENRTLFNDYKLKSYEISYSTLNRILDISEPILKHEPVWQDLKTISKQKYFYSTVKSVEDGYCQTYDIHVPNDHTFIANGFISHNTFLLAIYSLLKALLVPGSKIVICGAGFRQSKMVFKEIEKIYNASPLVQECCSDRPKYASDAAYLNVGHSTITAIPIGDGEKIRGTRATTLICDEFASISEEIFEIVISPFTAVHVDPAERAIVADFTKRLKKLQIASNIIEKIEESQGFGNQIVIAGTASYKHNHFYKRYKTYKAYIDSQGDIAKLKKSLDNISLEITGQGTPISEEEINSLAKMWKHYSILQLPYTAIPAGVMDEDSIRANKAKIPYYRFAMEYLVQFPDDSDGFIKRSWIEESTPRHPHNEPVNIELYGDPRATYVMGLDPARHNDNFGCVVLKITPRGKEIVYCNAWNRTEYGESSRIIFEICKRFNVQYIAMDSGGGGWAVSEWLSKETKDVRPEELILLVPDQLQEKNIKLLSSPGKKILEMVNFSPSWTSEAAHALAASIQQKNLLFPFSANDELCYRQYMSHFNLSDISESEKELVSSDLWGKEEWEINSKSEKPVFGIKQHIDECINEVCAIIREVTPGGVEKFELPSISDQPEGLDMRRRDRFSALMLANYAAKVYASFGSRIVSSRGVSSGYNKRRTLANSFKKRGSVYY